MISLDNSWLISVGLGELPTEDKRDVIDHVYRTLERRVGEQLAAQMTDVELDRFSALVDAGDDGAARAWLETHMPHYPEVVRHEFDLLASEMRRAAPAVVDAVLGEAAKSAGAATGRENDAVPGRSNSLVRQSTLSTVPFDHEEPSS